MVVGVTGGRAEPDSTKKALDGLASVASVAWSKYVSVRAVISTLRFEATIVAAVPETGTLVTPRAIWPSSCHWPSVPLRTVG